jgi:hypothetical protein
MMMSWWKYAKPGDKVVCLEGCWENELYGCKYLSPEFGAIYSIREIVPCTREDIPGLLFAELVNLPMKFEEGLFEPEFDARFFRPIQTRSTETGFALLKSLLNTKTKHRELS